MLYPHVTEIVRAGRAHTRFARTQRELATFAMDVNPVRTVRHVVDHDAPHGNVR